MENINIGVGDDVEIELQVGDVKGSKVYFSKVAKIENQNEVVIKMPKSHGKVVELPQGDYYSFVIFTYDGIYKFSGKIVEYKKALLPKSNDYFAIIDLISNGEKIQRRQNFRFSCEIPMQFYRIDDFGNVNRDEMGIATVIDVGGGGIKFLSNFELAVKDKIQITLILNDDLLFLDSEVLYSDPIDNPDYKTQYRCKFLDISSSDKDIIIQYVFDAQRNILRRRKR